MIIISDSLFNFSNFYVIICFLILGTLFLTVVNAAFVAEPLILDILFSISVILAL